MPPSLARCATFVASASSFAGIATAAFPLCLSRRDLLQHDFQAPELPFDLATKAWRQLPSVTGAAILEALPAVAP